MGNPEDISLPVGLAPINALVLMVGPTPGLSATRKLPFFDFWRKVELGVAKSSSHHLSQTEIAGDNPFIKIQLWRVR
jgi:hypothetical protein